MRRFITYIYEYEQGNRGRNTGFIRTDLRENSCRMELQIRGYAEEFTLQAAENFQPDSQV